MDKFKLKGIWKGEYIYADKFEPSIIKTNVPFILKIKSVEDNGLFEGVCQDDPTISKIDFPAAVYGIIKSSELIFNKKYPKTVFQDNYGNLVKTDEPQSDIIYHAQILKNGKIFGAWKIERTFRRINDKVMEIAQVNGIWWMEKS